MIWSLFSEAGMESCLRELPKPEDLHASPGGAICTITGPQPQQLQDVKASQGMSSSQVDLGLAD